MDEPRGIVKDTTSRKDTKSSSTRISLELAALKASHTTYLNCMIQGYEEHIAGLENKHRNDIASLNAVHARRRELVKQNQEKAFSNTAVRSRVDLPARDEQPTNENQQVQSNLDKAIADAVAQTRVDFLAQIKQLSNENQQVKSTLAETTAELDKVRSDAIKERKHNANSVNNLKSMYSQKFNRLRKELVRESDPWFPIDFRGEGVLRRTILQQSSTPFRDLATEFLAMALLAKGTVMFEHKATQIGQDEWRTLEQLGLKSRSKIKVTMIDADVDPVESGCF